MEKFKQYIDKNSINKIISYLRKFNIPFRTTLTNYTTTIEYNGKQIKYITEDMSIRAFAGANKIKKDINEFTANEYPSIKKSELVYFDLMKHKIYQGETVYCVDIKSAYATILLNDGFISKETYNYLSTLKKKERLAAVGMLAARKDNFYFNGRELTGHQKDISKYENYFWWAVLRTSEIMRKISFDSSVFFWVDGIYFLNICDAYKAMKVLKSENFNYSFKTCYDFYYDNSEIGDLYKCFFYEKEKTPENFKIFNLRKPDKTKEVLISFFLNKHKLYLPDENK